LRLAWLAFLLYPANALFNVISLVANGTTLTGASLAQALLLDRLLPLVTQQPVAVAAGVVAVAAIIVLGRVAALDQEREREVLRLRGERAQTQAQVHAAAESTAATIIGRLDEHLAAGQQPKPAAAADADDAPHGPPFDEALLPLPEHFVGRGADLGWLLARLRTGGATGITALRGLGGIGKTSLAAVAVRQAHREGLFRDGIAVVPCLGLSDAPDVLRRVLTRFDPLRRQPTANDLAGLAETAHRLLDGKNALVVLDNVEPALTVAGVVAPLHATGATMLLTARQALPRAAVPAEASRVLDLLSPAEALDLFAVSLGRASAAQLSGGERTAAERIVAALDRHTLAIKLAGAYAADVHRDLGALARELEDPERAMALPEDETPQAVQQVFASSLDALPPETRRLFVTLAAFATEEFGRRAALAVGAALGLAQPESGLTLLVLRALLDATTDVGMPEGSDRERLRLHPLLRAYAVTQLATWSEAERYAVSQAIAEHYAASIGPSAERALALDELNIAGALEWAHAENQDALVVALCLGMRSFWLKSGRVAAVERYIPWGVASARAIAQASGRREDRLQVAQLDLAYANMLVETGSYDAAEQVLQPNLALRRELGDQPGAGEVLCLLADVRFFRGDMDDSERYTQQALAAFQAAHDRAGQGRTTKDLAILAYIRGEFDAAVDYCNQALAITREVGDRPIEGETLDVLGRVALARGQLTDAEHTFRRALELSRGAGVRGGELSGLRWLGVLAMLRGNLDEAARYFEQALRMAREIQSRVGEAQVLRAMGRLARTQRDPATAQNHIERSLAIARQIHERRAEGDALFGLGQLAEERADIAAGERLLGESLSVRRETQSSLDIAESCLALGRLLIEQRGNREEGCALLREAVQRYTTMGMPEAQEAREAQQRLGCTQ
jgi:tetratricopeptide (TPR) repeat protein